MSNCGLSEKYGNFLRDIKGAGYEDARALPAHYYTDADFLKIELEQLFGRQWVCVGRVEEIPAPGDYITCSVAQTPVVVMRDNKGSINAMSNVCRHRGTVLLEGSGNTQRIVCPYHHWSYGLDGQLLTAPFVPERTTFAMPDCKLPGVRHEVWHGFVFVTLDPDTTGISSQLGALEQRVGPYHLDEMSQQWSATEDWDINWKLLMENFMEGYHLSPLHRDTLHKVNPSRLCQHLEPDGNWFGYQVGFAKRVSAEQVGHSSLSDDQLNTCVMFAIPPGFAVGVGSDYSSFLYLQPLTANKVRVKMGLIFYGDTWSDAELESAISLFQQTMAEDKTVLLRVADGVKSSLYSPGPLANPAMEGTLWDFYQYLARSLV